MITYPAIIELDENGSDYNVIFPDLDGCYTFGSTKKEALLNAVDALSLYLEAIDSRKMKIPEPSSIEGDNIIYISPSVTVAFAIQVKQHREAKGLSQKDVASRLGIGWASYQRLENPRRTNPTLTTINRLEQVLGFSFIR